MFRSFCSSLALVSLLISLTTTRLIAQEVAVARPKPLKVMLILGGCCHDYAKQKEILKKGIEARIMAEVTIVYSLDKSTKARFEIYDNPDWAKGYDVVIHDECSADVTEMPYVMNILNAHKNGVPAINLHCAMHCYRTGTNDWFEFLGLQSSSHGPQQPIDIAFVAPEHPIVKGLSGVSNSFAKRLENWTTINEELYNNLKLFDTAKPIARGIQDIGNRVDDFIVAWVNEYGPQKTRVFCTTLGHNNETVGDPRYLDMLCRALLWSCDKLSPEYQQPFAVARKELVPVNIARGKKATASASQDGHPPEHAVDGKEETRWCSPNNDAGQWWQVDLGEPQELTGIEIQWESDANYRYKVEGSADEKTWQMLSDLTKSDSQEQTQTLKFTAQGMRYVRLTTTQLTPGHWGSFFEFAVHGTKFEERTVSGGSDLKPRNIKGTGLLSGIKAPPGFEVTLFAAPPDVNYPTCLATSPDGTVYVGVDENGSIDRKEGRGKIVRCRDTDGDGKADEFQTFAKIDSPRGIVVSSVGWASSPSSSSGGNGKIKDEEGRAGSPSYKTSLIVLAPPNLYAFHDDNGDGESDRTETLVNGIGFDLKFRGADHTTNGIQVGIDGWIYVAVGDYGFIKATGADGHELAYRGGGIVRCRPDGSELEVVSRGQRNIYDVAISPELDLFTRDNTNDGGGWNVRLSHVPHGGHMGYPSLFINFPDEIIPPMADYGGGSPCGSLFIDEPTLPEGLGTSLYTCDWGRSIVYRHPLTKHGAGFTAEQEPFVELPRPTDMDIDASGNIYISSWRDGGFNFSKPEVGYVVKVRPPAVLQQVRDEPLQGSPVAPRQEARVPRDSRSEAALANNTDGASRLLSRSDRATLERGEQHRDDLLKSLASASHIARLNAQRDILARGESPEVVSGLERLAASNSSVAVRVAAIFTLKQLLGEKSHPTLVKLAKDASIREQALRALADRTTQLGNTPIVQTGAVDVRRGSPDPAETDDRRSPLQTGDKSIEPKQKDVGDLRSGNRRGQETRAELAPLIEALSDGNARVRLQAVRGLGRFGKLSNETLVKIVPLTVDADPVVAHVAIDSLVRLNAGQVCLAALDATPFEQRLGAAAVLKHLHDPAVVAGLIDWLGRPITPMPDGPTSQAITYGTTRSLVLAALCRLHSKEGEYTGDWWSTRPDTTGPYYKPVAWSETERITKVLQTELAKGDAGTVKGLLVQLKRHKIELPGTTERIVELAHADQTFFVQAVELLVPGSSAMSGDAARFLEVAATLGKSNAELRVKALRGLQRRTSQPEVLEIALRTFGEIDEAETNADVIAVWNEFIREPIFGKHVAKLGQQIDSPDASVAAIPLVREYFYAILIQAADNPRGEKAERDAALKIVERAWSQPELAISLLRAIGRSNAESQSLAVTTQLKSERPEVKAAAQFAARKLELDQEPPLDPKKPLVGSLKYDEMLSAIAAVKGDDKYGKKLFARQGCSACHTVSQNEPPKGPLLLDIAKRYKKEELIESIMKPSAKLAQGFESQFFVTTEGKVHDGFVVRESGDDVELRTVAGISIVLKKSSIDERGKREVSIMPLGLVDKLNADQVASLLAYLDSLRGK